MASSRVGTAAPSVKTGAFSVRAETTAGNRRKSPPAIYRKPKMPFVTCSPADHEQNTPPAWTTALQFPLVWEKDLREWIGEWVKQGTLGKDHGLALGERTLKRTKDHYLLWKGE